MAANEENWKTINPAYLPCDYVHTIYVSDCYRVNANNNIIYNIIGIYV